ncbi:alpha-L-rhamnosidase [Microbacterium sp. YJN-G]|uniref:alpha-L-rhamnosidase n=1 Tax=Microbacterium sp. YJN-G TaxID=2763257 RepID=UPI0018781561|nr:alpha-L-rhamnosidase [Microbacterium sp. YJN-G]
MTVNPTDLRTDGRTEPSGLGSLSPEFSWRLGADAPGQVAWELQVSRSRLFGPEATVWASGEVAGTDPFGIRYAGDPLTSTTTYHWRVRTWAADAVAPSEWASSSFATGILREDEWRAAWVAGPARGRKDPATTLYLRGDADVTGRVVRATAHVSSLGWHRLLVNGQDMTGPALVPRWTPLDQEVEYISYDVTDALATGRNVLGLVVGDGRFRGSNGFENHSIIYGDRLAGLVQVVIECEDGAEQVIVTDETWTCGTGRILTSDPKTGERVDLRIAQEWAVAAAAPEGFRPVHLVTHSRALIAESVERVQQVDELAPVAITRTKKGAQIVDFGQNFAGVVRLRLRGPAGTVVTLTHSEIIKADGTIDVDYIHLLPVGRWYQRDEVVLDGHDVHWQPWFTIHGFRYVEIRGLPVDLALDDVRGVVISSALRHTGEFECSDARVNRLWQNVDWSLRSNFVDTSTDCPTRERAGWTGDIQVFSPTATTLVDAQWFLRRYLHNLAVEQHEDGTVPVVIPSGFSEFSGGPHGHLASATTAAGWGDASVLVPWTLYRYYGDTRILADQYASMTAWVDSCARRAAEATSRGRRKSGTRNPEIERFIVDTGFQFGEWLRPGENAISSSMDARRNGAVVATAYLEHSARTLSDIAGVLGRDDDRIRYRALADAVRHAWRAAFLRADGTIGADRQDDYVRALSFGLLDEGEQAPAARRLGRLIDAAGGHLGTGFLSTPLLLDVLVDAGCVDTAWRLLTATSSPSWLSQVERGATTVWETWEGYTKSGKAKMSHNHYALGSVARFLTERIAGISPAEPGYRVIAIRPLVGGGLTSARAAIDTPYGPAESRWVIAGDDVEYQVTIPPGTTALFSAEHDPMPVVLGPGAHTLRRPLPARHEGEAAGSRHA